MSVHHNITQGPDTQAYCTHRPMCACVHDWRRARAHGASTSTAVWIILYADRFTTKNVDSRQFVITVSQVYSVQHTNIQMLVKKETEKRAA